MPAPRKLKKSESLEIRIPYPTKQAFMARCRADGVSASEALRAFIDGRLEAPPARRPYKELRLIAGVLAAAAVGAVALPSLARPSLRTEFERLDANRDGRIGMAEFSRGASVDVRVLIGASRLALAPASGPAGGATIRDGLLRDAYRRIDLDGDGAISFEEYRRYGEAAATAGGLPR